jgi:predicted small metal-binding protein
MPKELRCGDLVPGCSRVIRGNTEEEVLSQAAVHATKDHGMTVTPDVAEKVRGAIRDA